MVTFLWLFGNPLLKYLNFKRISRIQWLFWVIYQNLKRGLRLASGASSLHNFFHKNVPDLILYQLTKFHSHTIFPSQDIKQNVLLRWLLGLRKLRSSEKVDILQIGHILRVA